MSEKEKKRLTSKLLKEKIGKVPEKNLDYYKKTSTTRKKILSTLKGKEMTVLELSKETGIPKHEVFWHLMSLRKYGKLIECEEEDGYFKYRLKENGGE